MPDYDAKNKDTEALNTVAVEAEPVPSKFDILIEQWWKDHFHGSVVARYTDAFNCAYSAKEALKTILKNV